MTVVRSGCVVLLILAAFGCGPASMERDATPSAADAPDAADARPTRDAPPDDVDPACALGATEACLHHPPGPCPDLVDGREHAVNLRGLAHDHAPSCAGRSLATAPDAVLPLTLTQASDVVLTMATAQVDLAVIALYPADRCGEPEAEIQCWNGARFTGGTVRFQASNLAPGAYAVLVGAASGGEVRVTAAVSPARPRAEGDLCPGVRVVPDGPAVTLDTRRFATYPDHGTICGSSPSRGYLPNAGWVDGVVSYSLAAPRDVTIEVTGTNSETLRMDVSPACGAPSQALHGCAEDSLARRVVPHQAPGTYYITVESRAEARPDNVLTVRVVTAPSTPPGPAATCPGVPLAEGAALGVDVGTLTAGAPLACIGRQRNAAVFSLTTPAEPADVVVNVAAPGRGDEAAMWLRPGCGADPVGSCVGAPATSAPNAWARYRDLRPGTTYVLDAATSAVSGTLTARWYRVPATTETAVPGTPDCATAHAIPEAGGTFTGVTTGATATVASSRCLNASTGNCNDTRGAWYRLTLAARRRVVATLVGRDFDALLVIQGGEACPGSALPSGGACSLGRSGADASLEQVLDAGTYWVFVGGCGAAQAGRYRLDVMALPP